MALDFGDGATSQEQNPVHHFAEGTYTVTLVAWNHGGHDTAQRDVTIGPPDRTFSRNLYGGLIRYQDPDRTACVATAVMTMLNEIAAAGTGGDGFRWTPSRSYSVQTSLFRWTRRHDTLEPGIGSDANGWRNALNQYGWADYADPDTRVYQVFAFRTYNAAVKAAVQAVARFKRPVGILGWAGGHAQVLNGYTVFGQDPATSSNFTVRYVYLTDPLRRDRLRNARISDYSFHYGALKYRFRWYRSKDSPYDDPYTPGVQAAWRFWYNRFVIVAPTR